ncbi:MAG: MFS transporter [Deltaproteobacteria bacterium]|nr:MFS transporter [Deltaproteobacteria bacterium]
MIPLRKKLFWISLLYFAEGLPLGIVYDVLPVYFRQHQVSLKEIGFMFFLTLPWAIKVFWSPLVDRLGRYQNWISVCLLGLGVWVISIPFFDPSHPALPLWTVLLLFSLTSATQDIAIDAYSIGLVEKGEEGVVNGFRVSLYRIALMAGGGGTMFLVRPLGWQAIYFLLGGTFLLMALVTRLLPQIEVTRQTGHEWKEQFLKFITRSGAIPVFLFILTYKMGDLLMGPMVKPFWVDRGMTPEEIGAISTIGGALMTIVGAMIGGVFTSRYGIFRGLWVLGITQAISNLNYGAVAALNLPKMFLYGASLFESFTGGLGTAAFLAFLMRICEKSQAATQYALLSALFGLTRFFGGWSGLAVESLGYSNFFFLTFLFAFPSYLFLPWARRWLR